jgi:oligopeptide/dipeptide ABC transporter ATP-binding protein
MADELLQIDDLTVVYRARRSDSPVTAVNAVSLAVRPGETLGVVGESGSGKSTLAKAVLGLVPITSGSIRFGNADITSLRGSARRRATSGVQAIFQDPYSSLNPSRTVGDSIAEGLTAQRGIRRGQISSLVAKMTQVVGLPVDSWNRYPAMLSGGQRQRVAIARAVIGNPRLVLCDEVTSALDLSVQAQILNLLLELQATYGLSLLFIGHDLPVVRHLSHRILVLYRGKVVEEGPADVVYDHPQHPYTRALLAASPVPDPVDGRFARGPTSGLQSAPLGLPSSPNLGCPFVGRCPYAGSECVSTMPTLEDVEGVKVACLRRDQLSPFPAVITDGPEPQLTRAKGTLDEHYERKG